MTTTTDIPTIDDADEAAALMEQLRSEHEWVSVFWDKGWGDADVPLQISIIVDGDGQKPIAWITKDVYKELTSTKVVRHNTLQTFKARKLHDYKAKN